MREIKFRWYNAKHKKWLYWFYFENRWDWYITTWDLLDNPFSTPDDFKIERWSVSQYTGLNDKNGKEIYEWDIVYIAWKWNTEIKFTFIDLYEASMENDIWEIVWNIYKK